MEEIAAKINEEIKNSNVYKEYIFLKEKIEKNEYLANLNNELEMLKKEICSSKNEALVDLYYKKETEYKSNPIVKDYVRCKESLNELLKDIVDILSLN